MAKPPLADLISRYDVHPNASAQEEAFFRIHCRRLSRQGAQLLGYFLLGVNLLSWPTDLLIFSDSPETIRNFALWRLVLTA
ncbi:MAG TPA: hypothetical protein PKI03_24220 [Pseudomonadota bacterium]|nr:hypothetical protein [Pseudomonadota bacterium]